MPLHWLGTWSRKKTSREEKCVQISTLPKPPHTVFKADSATEVGNGFGIKRREMFRKRVARTEQRPPVCLSGDTCLVQHWSDEEARPPQKLFVHIPSAAVLVEPGDRRDIL